MGDPREPQRAHLKWIVAISAVVCVSAWVRLPGFTQGGFANHDVAGILYNAMLLHAGELPYVASLEMKEPGTFYLAAVLAGPGGTDISRFQVAANLWALASLVATARITWTVWGPRSAFMATVLLALHDAFLDTMDANYVTWALLPMVLAMSWSLDAAGQPPGRRRWVGFGIAGACAGMALLFKRQAGVAIALVLLVAALRRPGSTESISNRARVLGCMAAIGGVAAVHLPIVMHYGMHGELSALWEGYVINRKGLSYVSFGLENMSDGAAREGLLALGYFLALPLSLALFAAFPPRGASRRTRVVVALLWSWVAATCFAAAIGFRFYKGYFLAVAPPLCMLAASPWGLLGRAYRLPRWCHALLLIPALVLLARQVQFLHFERINRARPHDLGGRTIAKHILANAPHDSRIWVWGWHLWDVYPLTGMRSPSRMYKNDGLLTTGNDATWRRPRSPLRFVDGAPAAQLLADFDEHRPFYVVLGSSVPAQNFQALQVYLRKHYVRDAGPRIGRVQYWKLRSAPPSQ